LDVSDPHLSDQSGVFDALFSEERGIGQKYDGQKNGKKPVEAKGKISRRLNWDDCQDFPFGCF
jgi:hypothetical protein